MYVHLRGLGGPPTNKQFYLTQLEAAYKKHLASGDCPFNALLLAGNDTMAGSEENPDAMAAMEEFSAIHAQEAMTVPCVDNTSGGGGGGGGGGTITDYDGGHTDTTAQPSGSSWQDDLTSFLAEDDAPVAQPTLVGRAKPVNLTQPPSNYVAVPPATISQKAIALAFPGRSLSTFQAAPWAARVPSMRTQDIVSTGAPAVTQGAAGSVGVGKVLLGAAIFAGIAYVLYESSKGMG